MLVKKIVSDVISSIFTSTISTYASYKMNNEFTLSLDKVNLPSTWNNK